MARRFRVHILLVVLSLFLASACSDSIETVKVNPYGWQIEAAGIPVAEVYEIHSVGDLRMPTYSDCANEEGESRSPNECALNLIFLASPDYDDSSATDYGEHVQAIIRDVFGAPNPLNRNATYGQRLRPFKFYATEYRYAAATPRKGCDFGLPVEWAPSSSNGRDVDAPAWDCNLALSTASVELDVGFVMHKADLPDLNKYNLFSSEYNSYATILHELSHAAFAMSDEAPSVVQGGAFFPRDYPNIFHAQNERALCEVACKKYASSCIDIPKVDRDGQILDASQSGFLHCSLSPEEDASNLMYFFPQPLPGDNANWADRFDYRYASIERLRYIFNAWCNLARC